MQKQSKDMTRYLPGAILILSGVLIVAFPMLLVAFVSGLLILGGIVAIAIAHKVKRFQDATGHLHDSGHFYGSFWNQSEKVFHQDRWH
jgi:uncharacterized membrane protein HdeD (DUF308 family)